MNDIFWYHNVGDVGNAKGFHHFEILFPKKKAIIVSKNSYDKKVSKVKSLSKKTQTHIIGFDIDDNPIEIKTTKPFDFYIIKKY